MKYYIIAKDYYGVEWIEFETDNYSEAYDFVEYENNETCNYLQNCQEEHERPGNTVWYRIETIDEDKV